MKSSKLKLTVVGIVVVGIALFLVYNERSPKISFDPDRKEIYLLTGTILIKRQRELRSNNGKWFVIDDKYGIPSEISTPYPIGYNSRYKVVLETQGTLALVSNDDLERSELRWFGDHWKHKDPGSTEWLEFGDPDPPEREN